MSQRFIDTKVSREGRYSLGRDEQGGSYYLSIPVANRMVDYEEYYELTPDQYRQFSDDEKAGRTFADECRARRRDELSILKPGSDRGTPL